ncbi:MAG TPA: hypothetical protein PK446_08710, partial [Methanomassiliicoccaceae archaeon]|nr:hypothetical protein [Methanomassiliicoccaceae archaeon]
MSEVAIRTSKTLTPADADAEVVVQGWAQDVRNLGGISFLVSLAATGQQQPSTSKTGFTLLPQVIGVGANPSAIVARDLNEDGLPELITADRGVLFDLREERPANDEISVLWAQSPWNYAREVPPLKTGFGPWALSVANVDGLKWPD